MRKPLIVANWKMNPSPLTLLRDKTKSPYHPQSDVDVVVFPAFLDIPLCIETGIVTGGQYGRPEKSGAFTGDISMDMLKNIGCRYVLCGHSERRVNHKETDKEIANQFNAALAVGLQPIICIGEQMEERERNIEKEVIAKQMSLIPQNVPHCIIAYEPAWAIGTGCHASPHQIDEMHIAIRSLLSKDIKEKTSILYGGSVNATNVNDLLNIPDVDGVLVGSASLKPQEFGHIVNAARSNL